jgi:hypothetical protein
VKPTRPRIATLGIMGKGIEDLLITKKIANPTDEIKNLRNVRVMGETYTRPIFIATKASPQNSNKITVKTRLVTL